MYYQLLQHPCMGASACMLCTMLIPPLHQIIDVQMFNIAFGGPIHFCIKLYFYHLQLAGNFGLNLFGDLLKLYL